MRLTAAPGWWTGRMSRRPPNGSSWSRPAPAASAQSVTPPAPWAGQDQVPVRRDQPGAGLLEPAQHALGLLGRRGRGRPVAGHDDLAGGDQCGGDDPRVLGPAGHRGAREPAVPHDDDLPAAVRRPAGRRRPRRSRSARTAAAAARRPGRTRRPGRGGLRPPRSARPPRGGRPCGRAPRRPGARRRASPNARPRHARRTPRRTRCRRTARRTDPSRPARTPPTGGAVRAGWCTGAAGTPRAGPRWRARPAGHRRTARGRWRRRHAPRAPGTAVGTARP